MMSTWRYNIDDDRWLLTSLEQNDSVHLGPINGIPGATRIVPIIRQRKIIDGEHRPLRVGFHAVNTGWAKLKSDFNASNILEH